MQGRVTAIDDQGNRVLVDMVVPVWVTVHENQTAADFSAHEMVNCYLQSGTSFVPAQE